MKAMKRRTVKGQRAAENQPTKSSYILLWILIMKPEEKVDIITKSLQWVKYCLDFDKNTPICKQQIDGAIGALSILICKEASTTS